MFAGTGNIYKVSVSDGSYSILTTIPGTDISTIGIVYYQEYVYVIATAPPPIMHFKEFIKLI